MKSTGSASSPSSHLSVRRATRRTAYRTHLLAALALVLLLLTVMVHLPLHEPVARVGWTVAESAEPIAISEFEMTEESESPDESAGASEAAVLPTRFERPINADSSEGASVSDADNEPEAEGADSSSFARDLTALKSADEAPEMVGGKGSLYLRIHYPEEARKKGIEGRLVLSFIVDREGYPHNVSVRESLHALLDSAAVRALRETRFVPARRNGKRIPVRMNLPVRFKLLNGSPDAVADKSGQDAEP